MERLSIPKKELRTASGMYLISGEWSSHHKRSCSVLSEPPLKESFQKKYGFDEEKAIQSVVKYRERFDREGIFECELYAGVAELIQELHGKGYHLAVASSKPETACQRIIEHFHLETYFDGVYGATLDGSISTKKQVLEHVFKENGMKREDTILIGDTKFEVIGAKKAESHVSVSPMALEQQKN